MKYCYILDFKKKAMKKITLLAVLFCAIQLSHAQETNPISGGEATGVGGTISYTVGQLVYTTHTTGAGSLSQGIQQSIEFVTLSNPELTALTLKAVTYPNPTTEFITLALKDGKLTGLSYVMYDLLGRLVNKGTVVEAETKITMKSLPIGVYILRVRQNNKALKTFKIIKNK
ncbi:MAG: hypothetical protein ACJAVD_000445 [Porticoccaceae bacterium]|jgi:hypothetical protein